MVANEATLHNRAEIHPYVFQQALLLFAFLVLRHDKEPLHPCKLLILLTFEIKHYLVFSSKKNHHLFY